MYTAEDRNNVSGWIVELGERDSRVVAGAVIGSLAHGEGDRWSDIDLTFAVADGTDLAEVLQDWTRTIRAEFDAVRLFDLPSGGAIYRVFLLPGCLQVDLSFAPAETFAPAGPKFRLLFGAAGPTRSAEPRPVGEFFGYAVHHALRARFCIERDRPWQAEYWISSLRDEILALACRRRGREESHGRGVDGLPVDLRDAMSPALVRSFDRAELLRALAAAVAVLMQEAPELSAAVEPQLRELSGPAAEMPSGHAGGDHG